MSDLPKSVRAGMDTGVSPACFPDSPELEASLAKFAALNPDYNFRAGVDDGVACVQFDRKVSGSNPVYCKMVEMVHQGSTYAIADDKPRGACREAMIAFNKTHPKRKVSISWANTVCGITMEKN